MGKFLVGLAMMTICGVSGCARITLPETISVGGYDQPAKVDSERVPKTRNHEECRMELNKAYTYIRRLEQRNIQLQEDKDTLKKRLKRYEEK